MKTEEFKKKDGTEGVKHIPEAGDTYVCRYNKVMVLKGGLYENYSLGVKTVDGDDVYLRITKGQKVKLDQLGDLNEKTIEFYNYSNEFGEQVGVGFPKDE